ncbi:uncharacterized protein LOC123301659 [Chrysoperla carnea]|uniref:uncharacterized protein LOC123301659 n=1 Tax=Chrysoperla carnea TaxID=189513 RepID=UPI001D07B892|nr:uncharacterized protein LOC123301659 [Chrysoperla carnea]
MGKKRKFNRFIKWIKSDLPEEKTSVLLLGVTKISSPVLQRRYPNKQNQKNRHTLHFPATSTTEFNGIEDQQNGQQSTVTITDVLTENSQNVDKQLKPQTSPVKSLSFSNTKENTSPQLAIKSSSFSIQQQRKNNNRKRVSFSNDLIRSRDIARFNRDIKKLENSEINHHFIEIPVGYYNNYTAEDDDTCQEACCTNYTPRGRRRSSVDVNQFDEILDEISNDLNIRPITSRRNSSTDSYRKISIDSDPVRKHSSTSAPQEILLEQTEDEEIDLVDENFNRKINEKFYSENDIYDKLSPKIAQPRKLSAPITSSVYHTDDYVNDFLNEIIDELNIGPKLRSRSQSIITETTTPDKSSGEATSQAIDSSSYNGLVSSSITSEEDTSSTISSSSVPILTTSSNSTVAITPPPIDVSEEVNLEDQQVIMDRSVDSIGSCSLDVDLSTDFSDSSRGSISDCTLRSVSILTPLSNGISSIKQQQSKSNDQETKQHIEHDSSNDPIIKITDTTTTSTVDQEIQDNSSTHTKKPSYLNLACCVNGYSNLTTYDSKLRETYRTGTSRSREVSPNRPLDNNVCGYNNYQMTKGGDDQPLSTYLTPDSAKHQQRSSTLSPNHQRTATSTMNKLKMADEYHKINGSATNGDSTQTNITTATRKSTYFASTTTHQQTTTTSYLSKENRSFASSMLFNKTSTDVTDDANCMNKENHFTYKNENGLINKYISKSMINTHNGSGNKSNGGGPPREYNSDISINESRIKISPSKSFIQQRVERLYGPGALAQGFFIQTKRHNCSTSPLKYEKYYDEDVNCNEQQIYTSDSTPSLPVLRHLRPEFRAQLPILSPKRSINNENGGLQKSTTIPIALKDNLPPGTTSTTTNLSPNRVIRSAESLNDSNDIQSNDSFESIKELKNTKASENLIRENLNESITEYLPAAPQVILPVVATNGSTNSDTLIIKNGGDCVKNGEKELKILLHNENADDDSASVIDEQNKDGHYFLKILKNETERLNHLAEQVERELEEKMSELPEDALGYLRSASGKARLLVNQKMQQFEGLCHKNINQIEGEPFPTTAEDLQGFWDMVMLQINQVNDLFKDLDELRENNWIVEIKPKKSSDLTKTRSKLATKKATPTVQSAPTTANGEVQRMKREAQRKLMLEQRRAAIMAKKKSNNNDHQNVEIFVPESSTATLNS